MKKAKYLINTLMGLIQLLLGIRFILKIFDVQPNSMFVEIIYTISDPLVFPFAIFLPSTESNGIFVIELSTIAALIIYTLIGYYILGYLAKRKRIEILRKYK